MVEYNFVLLGLFPLFPGHGTGHRKGGRGPVIIIFIFFGLVIFWTSYLY